MAEQVDIIDRGDLGGTMRLGTVHGRSRRGFVAAEVYGATQAQSVTATATR